MAEIIWDEDDDTFVDLTTEDAVEIVISGVNEDPGFIAVEVPGPQGPEGPVGPPSSIPGPPGPQGAPGSSSSSYEHTQVNPSILWTIQHGLGYKPTLLVFDHEGNLLLGWKIVYESDTVLLLTFPMLQSGKANAS